MSITPVLSRRVRGHSLPLMVGHAGPGRRARRRRGPVTRVLLVAVIIVGSLIGALSLSSIASANPVSSWSGPTLTAIVNNDTIDQMISCSFVDFCIAVDESGNAVTYSTPSGWGPATSLSTGFTTISCVPGAYYCQAFDLAGNAWTYNAGTWTKQAGAEAGNHIEAVSCPQTTFCEAVNNAGNAYAYNSGVWSNTPTNVGVTDQILGISCTSSAFCVAINKGTNGNTPESFVDTGGSWAIAPVGGIELAGVSCVTTTFCMADDVDGNAYQYTGSWSTADSIDPGNELAGISCPTTSFCDAVDMTGNVLTYTGTWASAQLVDPTVAGSNTQNYLYSISCASSTFCATVDYYGNGFVYSPEPTVAILPSPLLTSTSLVQYTITVTGNPTNGAPTGTPAVTESSNNTCMNTSLTTSGDIETYLCSLDEVAPGPYTITANYPGDANYDPASAQISVAGAQVAANGGVSTPLVSPDGNQTVTGTTNLGANGPDTVTESDYSGDPVQGELADGNDFFDETLSTPGDFASVVINDCGVSTTATLSWWNPTLNLGAGGWAPVVGNPGPTNSGGCISVTLDNTTSPTLGELTATVFGVANSLQITSGALPAGRPQHRYSDSLAATGGNAPYKWSVSSGRLPAGLRLNKMTGVISGMPGRHDAGTYDATIRVVDKKTTSRPHSQNSATASFSIAIG